jgi:WD40 repeat protein
MVHRQNQEGHWLDLKDGDYAIRLWRLAEIPSAEKAPAQPITTAERLFTAEPGEQDSGVFAVAFSDDGNQALTGHFGGGVRLWDVQTGRPVRRLRGHTRTVHAVRFWPDGRHALTGGEDGTIRLWNLESGQEVRQFQGHTGRVQCLAISSQGDLVLSASADYENDRDNSVRLWDAQSSEELRRFGGRIRYTTDLVFASQGRHAYGVGPGLESITQWEVSTGEPVHRFPQFATLPVRLAISPDGRQLAAGYVAHGRRDGRWYDPENCMVRLWDLSTRSVVREFRGHTGPIADLAFTPNGRYLLTVADGSHDVEGRFIPSSDQTIRMWEVSAGREAARYEPQERVHVLAAAPDGRRFLSGGDSLRLWKLPESASEIKVEAEAP